MATTALQQARHFNTPEISIALPIINTLYAMPSISQLSSTATNITQLNTRNADADDADFLNVMIPLIVPLLLVSETYLSRNVLF